MDSIAERMKLVREQLGVSARALSLELGINASAWGVYESGTSLPGASVLAELARRNIDIVWLLTGKYNVSEPNRPVRAHDLRSALEQIEARESRSLGLSRLALHASRTNFTGKARILECLAARLPEYVSLDDICTGTQLDQGVVINCMVDLLRAALIECRTENDVELYRAASTNLWNEGKSEDVAALALDGLKFVAHDVVEGVKSNPEGTLLMIATSKVKDGRDFLIGLQNYLRTAGKESGEETVKLMIAARITI